MFRIIGIHGYQVQLASLRPFFLSAYKGIFGLSLLILSPISLQVTIHHHLYHMFMFSGVSEVICISKKLLQAHPKNSLAVIMLS